MPRKAQKVKFEDKTNPERCRATDGFSTPLKGEEVAGTVHCWPIEDKDAALVLIEDEYGDMCCYIDEAPKDD
jgi:hypothetical protein